MSKSPKIYNCAAVHDQVPGSFAQGSFAFCSQNLICSHGNALLDFAIENAQKEDLIPIETTEKYRELIYETRLSLREIDTLSILIQLYNQGHSQNNSKIVESLGKNEDEWQKNLKQKQMNISRPIFKIIANLSESGLLPSNSLEVKEIDSDQIVSNYKA